MQLGGKFELLGIGSRNGALGRRGEAADEVAASTSTMRISLLFVPRRLRTFIAHTFALILTRSFHSFFFILEQTGSLSFFLAGRSAYGEIGVESSSPY